MKKKNYIEYAGGNIEYGGNISNEILEFDPLTGQWKPNVGRMIHARSDHAVSVLTNDVFNFDSGLCVLS